MYKDRRDFPGTDGTTRLSVHLRFGTVSIRHLVSLAMRQKAETWLNELIWREFFMMLLYFFPHTVHSCYRRAFDNLPWENDLEKFEKWKTGNTGIPIVDAGMRELLHTGYMHNRVRIITASFLVKNLLIDWRWGEAWFAQHLNDFDLSANVGNWQWAASTGCDAAPYFRIFNPIEQQKKFDPDYLYIEKWVPEWNTASYPKPIVDLKTSREKAIKVYQATSKLSRGF
jgi:deoxyribodipyrimidine photo-lyase